MPIERTFSLIKPDAVVKNKIGEILARYEKGGLRVIACKMLQMTPEMVETLYHVHIGRPFFKDLVQFMSSGPVVACVLEGDDAVQRHRDIMGPTDPAAAAPGTIRADFGTKINRNAVHGSDAVETAVYEIRCLFRPNEICNRPA
jgi:nucleoside-diphosphate kinase